MTQKNYDAVVIGSGINGLTTATLLARQGLKVLVVDGRSQAGGLAGSEEFHPGFHSVGVLHDTTGLRPWVVTELGLAAHGLQRRADPVPVFAPQVAGQGRGLLLWRDPERSQEELLALGPNEAARYRDFRGFITRLAPLIKSVFDDPPPDVTNLSVPALWELGKKALQLRRLGKADMMEVLRIAPMCSGDWLSEWFKTDLLQAMLAGPSIYHSFTGPWSPGTNANLLIYEALAEAPVVGGAAAVALALTKAAKAATVSLSLNTAVQQVLLQDKKVTGIRLANGTCISTPIVAAACHPQRLFLDLMQPEQLDYRFERDLRLFRSRGTMAKIDLALRDYPAFACRPSLRVEYSRIGESLDALERAFDPIKYLESSTAPLLDLYVPTLENPALAPAGQHVLSVQMHFVAPRPVGGWTVAARDQIYQTCVQQLEKYCPEFSRLVIAARVQSPADLEQNYGLPGGHVLHGEHSADQLLVRPIPECAHYSTPFAGLFLCGSGSHPGGGVTGAPGALAARRILARRDSSNA